MKSSASPKNSVQLSRRTRPPLLTKLVHWDSHAIPFGQSPAADGEYWAFCVRLFRLYDACHKADLAVSVKSLDSYLWAVPGGP